MLDTMNTFADPRAALASTTILHGEKMDAHRAAEAARQTAIGAYQALLDSAASGADVKPADLERAEASAAHAGRVTAIASAVSESARRQRDQADVDGAFAEADALRAAHAGAVAARAEAANALRVAVDAAQDAMVRFREARADVMFAYQAGSNWDHAQLPARLANNPIMAGLDDKPHVGLVTPLPPRRVDVGTFLPAGDGTWLRTPCPTE